MDADQFDALSRTIGSRRGILAAALSGVTLLGLSDAQAKKRRRKKHCWRKKIKISCVDSCRTYRNISNCAPRHVRCKCRGGKTCLPNESCGLSCASAACPEGSGCTCSTSEPKVCLASFTACEDVPTPCETTADCPFLFTCDDTACGPGNANEKRCRPLCGVI